jgi:hypothetical protein
MIFLSLIYDSLELKYPGSSSGVIRMKPSRPLVSGFTW